MGNLSFIVPTKKLEDFNIDKIFELLSKEFNNLYFEVRILEKNKSILVTDIFFYQKCYILDYDRENPESESQFFNYIEGLKTLKELNPDLYNVIELTYGLDADIKNDIEFFLRDHFYAYIFDEGIHPEYIGPDYKRKINKISKWKNFIQKIKLLI